MKIVYLFTDVTIVGGADRVLTMKANYLAEHLGHDVYFITDSQQQRPFTFPLSPLVRHIDLNVNFPNQYKYPVHIRFFIYQKLLRLYKRRLNEVLSKIQPDIVIGALARELDFLTSLDDGSKKIGECHVARKYVRNFHLLEQKGGIHKLIARYWRRKQERAIRKLDAFVVLSREDNQNWYEVRSSIIIPNPLTISTKTTSMCNSKKVISVGRLNEQKGYDMLIQAWKLVHYKHPDWELFIYGEGALKSILEDDIKRNNLDTCIYIEDPTENIVDKYVESAFYVMSSSYEGFGLVLTEAMACGLPCISFDCPSGPREIITDKEDGWLIENGNISKLAEAICYFIENENDRKAMGMKAVKNVTRYSQHVIMNKWNELFTSLQDQ